MGRKLLIANISSFYIQYLMQNYIKKKLSSQPQLFNSTDSNDIKSLEQQVRRTINNLNKDLNIAEQKLKTVGKLIKTTQQLYLRKYQEHNRLLEQPSSQKSFVKTEVSNGNSQNANNVIQQPAQLAIVAQLVDKIDIDLKKQNQLGDEKLSQLGKKNALRKKIRKKI